MTPCPVCGRPNFEMNELRADVRAYGDRKVNILFCAGCGYWQPCSDYGDVVKVLKLR